MASVEYGQQARILLYMKQEQQDEAERWLTEALNTATQLEQVGSEYVEVPAEREKINNRSDYEGEKNGVFREFCCFYQ